MSFLSSLGLGTPKQTNTNPGGNPTQNSNQNNDNGNQNNNQGNGNQGQNNGGEQHNTPGGNNNNVNSSQEPANPMDAWAKMFDNQPDDGDKAPNFTIDDEVLNNVSGQLDFAKDIPSETLQAAMNGDQQAFLTVMNTVGRGAYRSAMKHNSTLTDKFVGMREEHSFKKGIPGIVRDELTMGELGGNAGKMSPATRKQLAETAKRIQRLHPDASPQEIAQMSRKYISDMFNELNPDANPATQQQKKQAAEAFDWDSWADTQ